MSWIRGAARAIRHLPFLEKAEFLWRLLRPAYLALLKLSGSGVAVRLGGACPVRMPPEYVGGDWEDYEPCTFRLLADWGAAHPAGLVLDIGSSIGVFTLAALETAPDVRVVAFDADLPSLLAVRRMTRFSESHGRLTEVYGLVSEEHQTGLAIEEATSAAKRLLEQQHGKPAATRYVTILDAPGSGTPVNSIDGLFAAHFREPIPVLMKIDVEGAELLVLRGAQRFLAALSPALILSVHPATLPEYGHTVEDVRQFLIEHGYSISLAGSDHEEHWWCTKPHLTNRHQPE
jgi:FkbM family methyltransferase